MEPSRVASLVSRVGEGLGYDVIQVKVDHTRNVRVWVDHPRGVTAEATRSLSKEICFALDEAGTDPGAYRFEVQSPGVDRLLARPQDFERFAGKKITLRLRKREDLPAKLNGVLQGWVEEQIVVQVGDEVLRLPLADVREARLVPELPFLSEGEQRAQRDARKGKQKKGGGSKSGRHKGGGHRKRKRKSGR
ncbi:MAG: hypothetical protein KDD82_03370 [Planctomycetes bacterium]|nr:hypothetical protein [Planctomycetota bacterium]